MQVEKINVEKENDTGQDGYWEFVAAMETHDWDGGVEGTRIVRYTVSPSLLGWETGIC